ncbi:GPRNNA1 [Cordylochernes scorpioides]|uniref:GPRNNA1 n=1 Tax=Cordylochernes scorpioides TaxID=51811 RepID=A0ABY6KRW1_9ARAC|nr:GPRNNA1 [Cordylochernes scorpioides]
MSIHCIVATCSVTSLCVQNDTEYRQYVLGAALTGTCVLGLAGNAVSLCVLLHPQMRGSSVNCGLQGLAVFDSLVLASAALALGLPALALGLPALLPYRRRWHAWLVPLVYPLGLIAQTGSVWTTVGVTLERYVAVCHPLRARSLCTQRRARVALLTVAAFSLVYNAPRFFEVYCTEIPSENGDNQTVLVALPTPFRRDPHYVQVYYIWLYLLVMYFVPFALLFALNALIWRTVQSATRSRNRLTCSQRHEIGLALMLFCVVVIFFVCNLLGMVANILEHFQVYWKELVDVSNLLVSINSSVNFIIYCLFGKKFRRILGGMLLRCCPFSARADRDLQSIRLRQTSVLHSFNGTTSRI